MLRHPWTGTEDCPAATAYRQQLRERYEREAQTLANLTGWNIGEIRKTMNLASLPTGEEKKWYQRIVNELEDHVEGEAGMLDFALDDSTSTANEPYLD
ncbi:MAG: hypothetical protein ACXWWG_11460 [Nitrospira sp.]